MKFVWKLSPVFVAFALLFGLLGFPPSVAADSGQSRSSSSVRLLVQFEPGTTANDMVKVHRQAGGEFERVIPGIGVQVIRIPRGLSATSAYLTEDKVRYIEADGVARTVATPDDTHFSKQWALTKVQAPEAWDVTQGSSGINIAILDTGVDVSHPDLSGKVVSNINFTDSPTPYENGADHGTHAAGIAAAITDNGIGVAGLGYSSSIINVKVLGDDDWGYYSWIAEGITWAADNGADVISMSLGSGIESSTLEDAVNYAWNRGVVVVASAGNNGDSVPFYPAYYSNCIAVAGSTESDILASWSNRGAWVDVAATGSSIYSTLPDGDYGYKSGTSMAAPNVAGLCTLVFSVTTDTSGNGKLNDEVRYAVESTCDDVGINVAYGRINAYDAVQMSSVPVTGEILGIVRVIAGQQFWKQ